MSLFSAKKIGASKKEKMLLKITDVILANARSIGKSQTTFPKSLLTTLSSFIWKTWAKKNISPRSSINSDARTKGNEQTKVILKVLWRWSFDFRFIMFLMESPQSTHFKDFGDFRSFFNWTMTYRRDSDIVAGYGQIRTIKPTFDISKVQQPFTPHQWALRGLWMMFTLYL